MAEAGFEIDVRADWRQVDKALRLFPNQLRDAQSKAMNSALRRTSREARRIAEEAYNILPEKMEKLRTRNRVKRAKGSDLQGELIISGKVGVPLRYFRARPRRVPKDWSGIHPRLRTPKGGVRFQLKKGGRWTSGYDRKPPGNQTLFWIKGKQGQIVLVYRVGPKLSSKNLYGPSLIQAVFRRDNSRKIAEFALDDYGKKLRANIRKALKEAGLL